MAVRELCRCRRSEGETAFPALATVLVMVRGVVNDRRRRETTKRMKGCTRCNGIGMEIVRNGNETAARVCECRRDIAQ